MNRITPLTIVIFLASLLAACSGSGSSSPGSGEGSALQLTVESATGEGASAQAEEAITYNYVVTNTGMLRLSGPAMVDDPPRQVACPQFNTVGNLDSYLDQNESVTCTAYYTPSEADRSSGSITNRARAVVGGAVSNETGMTLNLDQSQSAATSASAPAVTPEGSTDGTQTPSIILTATPGSSLEPTQGASTLNTQTPLVIPTATLGSSADVTPANTASAGTVNVVEIPAGSDNVLLTGIAPAGGSIRYSWNATAGQQVTLTLLVTTTNQLAVLVTGPDGAPVKTEETAMPWSGTIPASGEYLIDVRDTSGNQVQPFVLELRLSP